MQPWFTQGGLPCTYILLTKRDGRTGRISARGLDSTDRAQRGPYKKDRFLECHTMLPPKNQTTFHEISQSQPRFHFQEPVRAKFARWNLPNQRMLFIFVSSLFQALGQWGRSKKRAGEKRDQQRAGSGREKDPSFFPTRPHSSPACFFNPPLAESLEQATLYPVIGDATNEHAVSGLCLGTPKNTGNAWKSFVCCYSFQLEEGR